MHYAGADGSHYDISAELQMSSRTVRLDQDAGAEPDPYPNFSPNSSLHLSLEFNQHQLSPNPRPFTFPGPWLLKTVPLLRE